MSMIRISNKGDFSKTLRFLHKIKSRKFFEKLNKYGQVGVDALSNATPKRSGKTAASWSYEVHVSGTSATISWTNSNENKGIPIVVLIQYGHGTRNGGYVPPNDFINPAMRPIFEQIAEEIWMEVIADE